MLGTLFVSILLLLDSGLARAGHREFHSPLGRDIYNQAVETDSTAEDLAAFVSSVQEWNQLIPQKFRDIPEAANAKRDPFDFDSMGTKLNSLEFGALHFHLAALHRSPQVRSYVGAQRRLEQRMLAQANQKNALLASSQSSVPPAPIAAVSAPGKSAPEVLPEVPKVLEAAHSRLAVTYPTLFADQVDRSSAHPGAAVDGMKRDETLLVSSNASVRTFVEAFNPSIPVLDGSGDLLSKEPGETGWFLSSGYQHIPTLEWAGNSHGEFETPLISQNTSWMLSRLVGAPLQRDAGLVFGKLAAGWKLEFSGRAEEPIYLDSDLRLVSTEDASSERYFVFLNAAPGAHLVYLNQNQDGGEESGAVAFPVLGGIATYLDLTRVSYTRFNGHVVFAGDELEGGEAVSSATVRLIGQPSVAGITNSKGSFQFDHVMVISDYPLFVETDKGRGFTHRYRVLPKNLHHLNLYRLPRRQIQDWLSQVEGGVSADSAILLAAVPGIASRRSRSTLIPSVRSIVPSLQMFPETYTLTPTDLLMSHTPIEEEENRFLGVEVPEGPVLAQVSESAEDNKKEVVWSELTIASPNVVTLVGPY